MESVIALMVVICVSGVLSQDIPTLLKEVTPGCPGSVSLSCFANEATNIFFQVFEVNGNSFLTLTSVRIREDPDYNELRDNNIYTLQVINTEKHNESRFRCAGSINRKRVYSNEVKLLLAGCIESTFVIMPTTGTPPIKTSSLIPPLMTSPSIAASGNASSTLQYIPAHTNSDNISPGLAALLVIPFVIIAVLVIVFITVIICYVRRPKLRRALSMETQQPKETPQPKTPQPETLQPETPQPETPQPEETPQPKKTPQPKETPGPPVFERVNASNSRRATARSSQQVLPGIPNFAEMYRPRRPSAMSGEFTTTSQPYGQLEASISEFAEDGLHTSEAVTDDETSGAIVYRDRLLGPQSIRHHRDFGIDLHRQPPRVQAVRTDSQSQMRTTYLPDPARSETVSALDLAENVQIFSNPAYEPIVALDLADVCMTKNPSYVPIQPWQREPVARYKSRTIEPSPTIGSRPLPRLPLLKDDSIMHRINQAIPLPVQTSKTAIVRDGGDVEESTSPVYTSAEGIALDEEELWVAPAVPIISKRDLGDKHVVSWL